MISTTGIRYGAIKGIVASKATFYQQAAEKTMNPIGRRVFLSVMEDEKRLLEDFKGIQKERHMAARGTGSTKKIKGFLERIKATTDDVEALKIAMEMEKESIELYRNFKEGTDPKGKSPLQSLVNEEQQRYAESLIPVFSFLTHAAGYVGRAQHYGRRYPWA